MENQNIFKQLLVCNEFRFFLKPSAKCIDKYIELRIKQYEELQQTKKTTIKIDPALEV